MRTVRTTKLPRVLILWFEQRRTLLTELEWVLQKFVLPNHPVERICQAINVDRSSRGIAGPVSLNDEAKAVARTREKSKKQLASSIEVCPIGALDPASKVFIVTECDLAGNSELGVKSRQHRLPASIVSSA